MAIQAACPPIKEKVGLAHLRLAQGQVRRPWGQDVESKSIVEVLISWFPMLLLIGVWIFFMRTQGKNGFSTPGENERLEEMRRQTREPERIVALSERR